MRAGADNKSDVVYLIPGGHVIHYEIKKETQAWKDWVAYCNALGYTFILSGKTCYRPGSNAKLKNSFLGGVPRYHKWVQERIVLSLEAGKEYWLSELRHLQ